MRTILIDPAKQTVTEVDYDGDTIGELDAFDELGQLIPPVQPAPGL